LYFFSQFQFEVLFVNSLKEIVELLVSAGAEVNCRDKDLMTPLHAAAAATGRQPCGI
jgi:ankyrin repeat protein